MNAAAFRLDDLREKYAAEPVSEKYLKLYAPDEHSTMFAVLHEKLNEHFDSINRCSRSNRHYWAEPSRELLALIETIRKDLHSLKRAGVEVLLREDYDNDLAGLRRWISPSGGSPVPEDFQAIDVEEYAGVFINKDSISTTLTTNIERSLLKPVGSGSYADVYSYVDPNHGIKFALKCAKAGTTERDLARFKREFEMLQTFRFPNVVEVYRYDDDRNEYSMEYCDESLRKFVSSRNSKLAFAERKTLALQCLYGLNYIHQKRCLHRDVSPQNMLVRVYDEGAFVAKTADLGLLKDLNHEFTKTHTELRGTRVDPALESFKDFQLVHEMYAVGWLLWFIFTGRDGIDDAATGPVADLVRRCINSDNSLRPGSTLDLIEEVRRLTLLRSR
jgi:eukaryotic-like serine/threonine-protein kinase